MSSESPLDYKEIQPVHPKGNQSWIFIGRTDAEVETPILWPPDVKNWLIWKDPDAGKGWGQEAKGMTEDEMAGWHHRLDGREFEWTLGVGDGQGGLVCCSSGGLKESDTTDRLNWTECTHRSKVFFVQLHEFSQNEHTPVTKGRNKTLSILGPSQSLLLSTVTIFLSLSIWSAYLLTL